MVIRRRQIFPPVTCIRGHGCRDLLCDSGRCRRAPCGCAVYGCRGCVRDLGRNASCAATRIAAGCPTLRHNGERACRVWATLQGLGHEKSIARDALLRGAGFVGPHRLGDCVCSRRRRGGARSADSAAQAQGCSGHTPGCAPPGAELQSRRAPERAGGGPPQRAGAKSICGRRRAAPSLRIASVAPGI